MNKSRLLLPFFCVFYGCDSRKETDAESGNTKACQAYVDAATACSEESGGLEDFTPPQNTCKGDDGSNDEFYECLAEAWASGDCSTQEKAIEVAMTSFECIDTGT